ncbi:metallophosphoesterase [Pseudomonas sp. 10B1]|uniref:metallophosphoesterase n=1 Tax=unclassified Pseudomonas TaxID=196821 RepID=UPI002B2278D8|nr:MULTISPECIES: metallophosphoesterase [unclassified Pseudomonas]MEA9994288.1 metallophosphoesterase [Pseudomonas sp. AA4]MEB0088535.1 metallophosphoesterase [Pseudomonas sp. RTI1]MEB0126542.1 metallophosphoesterase [Pseudomonas sp. CCC1.2]MEB0154645.1 metallophosphoesterase [Pseudomonas sp. CCC4.3]MEB0221138.1 metallophosphoesterase [Pseudomonas sp. AB12(2023)]
MSQLKRFEINTTGRDFAVGDIHGHFTKLQAALDAVNFDPAVDRLFSVGDLIDRGPESDHIDTWLAKPWFHSVRGNHEQMAIEAHGSDLKSNGNIQMLHMENGGLWLYGRLTTEINHLVDLLASLPVAIEVMTLAGLVGIVHADCPFSSWDNLREALTDIGIGFRKVEAACQWSRNRISSENQAGVCDIRAVIVGHSVVQQPAVLGNVYHIDTGGWMDGHFTLIDLATLQCFPSINPKLSWDWEDRP